MESKGPEYLRAHYDVDDPAFVAVCDELPVWSAPFGRLLIEHVPLRKNIAALDVGCGTGFPLVDLAQRLGPTCKVHGVDPWVPAVERARRKIDYFSVKNAAVHVGDAAAMPFGDESFELIVSNLGINNFADVQATLKECGRVAKPSAQIALTTNLREHAREFYRVFRSILEERGKPEELERLEKHIAHRLSVEGIRRRLENAGFRLVKVHQEESLLRFTDGSALLRHSFIQVAFLNAWRSIVDPEDEKKVFGQLEEDLNQVAEWEGDLVLTIPMAYIEGEKFGG
jgi:ubiquinone/menaquinone biosynthesis C-methylase UbiE